MRRDGSEFPLELSLSTVQMKGAWHAIGKDTAGFYLGINKAFEELYGKSRDKIVGKSVFDTAPRELAEIYHAKDRELFRTPGQQVYDAHVRRQGTVELLCTEGTPGRIRVSIRDTGAGLDAEQVAQLFEAFNRLGQESGGKEGTGIGLVVAKRLVELMGGVICVESSVGVGSEFWFELIAVAEPYLAPEEVDATSLIRPPEPCGELLQTVLYVEDNPANLRLVVQIIARHPSIRLLTAVDGKSGIEIARISQPDVILMDINLPGIDGFEALTILRSEPATASIPVIALSANAMPTDIEKGLKAGFFCYITKPIKVNEFMATLKVALKYS